MRAQFIYEKFTEEGDPISDMGIGLGDKFNKWLDEFKIEHSYWNTVSIFSHS